MVQFFSKQLKDAELNYSAYDKELTSVFKAVTHFEWLLFGRKFILPVDHKPLLHLFTSPAKCERRRRQTEFLSTFEMSIEYLPGKNNVVADALSRDRMVEAIQLNPCFTTLPTPEIVAAQEGDDAINAIDPENKSKVSGVWRDSHGRLLVPQQYTSAIIKSVHSTSHAGKDSTLAQIHLSYAWPKIRRQVSEHVRNCSDCQASKITLHVKPPYKSFGSHPKFSVIHVDFVGPLPPNKNKRYL
jgi:putative transposase